MNSNQTVYQSRWGYHPCSHHLFLKLKQLHKWYWLTVYDFHRWHRWRRKTVYRSGPEPGYCPVFVTDTPWYKQIRTHGVDGIKVYSKTVVDLEILALYGVARRPTVDPPQTFDVETQTRIERLYEAVKTHFEGTASPTPN